MINLIFTRKSLLAGVKGKSNDLLTFDKQPIIEFGNRNMKEVLEESIPTIVEKFSSYAKKNKLALNGSIPATLVFPVETTSKEVHEVMHFVGTYPDVRFNIVHIDDLIQPFLYGEDFPKDAIKEPMIVMEGLDGYLSVLYYFNTTEVKHQSFITFEEKQAELNGQHVLEALSKEFEKIGFTLDENDKKELRYQHSLNNNTYFIQKSNGVATLSASVYKEDLTVDKSHLIDKYTLSRILAKEKLEKQGIKHIVLLGDHLVDYGYPEYLEEELGLKGMIYIPKTQASEQAFLTILNGVKNRTSTPFQPELKVSEILHPKTSGPDILDFNKLNEQLSPQNKAGNLADIIEKSKQEKETTEGSKGAGTTAKKESTSQSKDSKETLAKQKTSKSPQKQGVKSKTKETAKEKRTTKSKSQEIVPVKSDKYVQDSPAVIENKVAKVDQEQTEASTGPQDEQNPSIDILKESLAKLADKPEVEGKEVKESQEKAKEPVVSPKAETKKPAAEAKKEQKETPNKIKAAAETKAAEVKKEEASQKETKEQGVAEVSKSLATSAYTGLEEWNRLSEMEETLKKQEEEERKKFELLKEKLALQRQQKAVRKETEPGPIPNVPRKNARSINLKEAFEFIKNFPDEEFIAQLVLDKNLRAKKVLRFVSNADFAQSYIEYKFLRLYDKESRYYPGISGLYESEEGKFYMRNYYKGSTLAEYASKAGLARKLSLKKLSSSDLEFIVKVINEVSDSPVSHCNLHANNILVQEKGFWKFNTVEQIRLVGFTSDDCSKEEMLSRVHEIFQALLAPGVYTEFRNTLKL